MKKKHRKLNPQSKAIEKLGYGQLLRRTEHMSWHQVQIDVNVVTHEADPSITGNPGPVLAMKKGTFVGFGKNVQDALSEAHRQATEFMQSNAMEVGVDNPGSGATQPRRVFSPFSNTKQ